MEKIRNSKGYAKVLNEPWDVTVRREFGEYLAEEGYPLGQVLLREAAAMAALPQGTVPSVIHMEYHFGIQFCAAELTELYRCPFFSPADFAVAGQGAMCLVVPPISMMSLWSSCKKLFAKYQIEKYPDSSVTPQPSWCLMGTGNASLSKCEPPSLSTFVSAIVLHRLINGNWHVHRHVHARCMMGEREKFVGYKAGGCLYLNDWSDIGPTERIAEYRTIPISPPRQ